MAESTPETQFSIYKIDCERVDRVFTIKGDFETDQYLQNAIRAIINSSKSNIAKKNGTIQQIDYEGFQGLVFRTEHEPMWKGVIEQILSRNQLDKAEVDHNLLLKNINVSYILLYLFRGCIYALTGGFGSSYITKFADKNFGMYLIPKVVTIDKPVLRSLMQNHLSGNQLSSQRQNRKATNFILERDMGSIFRQLNIEIDDEIARAFGIYLDPEEKGRKISVVNKDSIVFHRSFSINEIRNIITKMDELWAKKDNFALNYLVLAKKKNYKNVDLFECLKRTLKAEEYNKFVLVGDDYSNYILNGRHFIIYTESNNLYMNVDYPLTIQDLFESFVNQEKEITLTFLGVLLKSWTLEVIDHDGNEIIPRTALFECLQGFVEFGANHDPVYLFNGEWYVFDAQYADALSDEFNSAFERYNLLEKRILKKHALLANSINETKYNKHLESLPDVVVTHTVLSEYVEIADAIFYDESHVYLMHNKQEFSGEGVRDVTGQVATSAEYLQRMLNSQDRDQFLRGYYQDIVKKRNDMKQKISESDFVDLFRLKEVCYIIGYISKYKKDTDSTYAEYLTVETERRLMMKGYKFLSLATSN